MKKVLHVLQSNRFSGAENIACQIIEMFKNEENYTMEYTSQEGPIRESILSRNIPFWGMKRLSIRELRNVVKKSKPDIIHAHDMRAAFIASIAIKKIPIIVTIHNNNFDSRKISIKSVMFLLSSRRIKSIIWVSQSAKDGYYFSKQVAKKSIVLKNIIEVNSIYKKIQMDESDYCSDIIFLGRLTYLKDPQRFIKIAENVVKEIPNVQISIVGTGELEEEVKKIIQSKKLGDNIKLYGYCNNPYKILSQSKILVLTSRSEGIPMSILEAQVLGVPVVATPVGDIADIIVNGKNGYLSDKNEVLEQEIINLLTHKEKWEEFSVNSKKYSYTRNNVENYRDKMSLIYEDRK